MKEIKKICVIGSGVMGSGIAAVAANASKDVILLDIADNNSADKNSITKKALEKLQSQKPPPLASPSRIEFITIGNLEEDLHLISQCDLIIEAIIEKIEIKHQLYNKIIPYLNKEAILASNTSTLPLKRLKENLQDDIRSRFLIIHFFNPPRYMELLELITDNETDPKIIERVSGFLTKDLGKTIVNCNDTPGFIANRAGCFLLELVVRSAINQGLNPVVIDHIFSSVFKLPSTGIFGLYDLIGHDVMKLISSSLINSLPSNDYYKKIYSPTPLLDKMSSMGLMGRKSAGGFYRLSVIKDEKVKEVISFSDLSYQSLPIITEEFGSIEELLNSNSVYGKFFNEILTKFYLYLCSLIPSVTDNVYDIDLAMKLGYSWRIGPFELLEFNIPNSFGWLIKQADSMKLEIPSFIANKLYRNIEKTKLRPQSNKLDEHSILILSNNSARLVNYLDSLVFIINTKMNCLNNEVFNLSQQAISTAEEKGKNLYIHPEGPNFSAGADLKFISVCIDNKDFAALEAFLLLGQQTMMKLKYSSVHVISCALGVALGGGCEILLHSDFIIAQQELNAGLVELGVGFVPGWGGIKEMFLRSKGDKNKLIKNLRNIIEQNKTSSADYFALDYYGKQNLKIIMNKNYILEEALQLDLPKKIRLQPNPTISLPPINLAEELNTESYSELQKEILSDFQKIVNLREVDEEDLLQFELQTFLKLARRKSS